MKSCLKNGIPARFTLLILLCFLCIPITFGCEKGSATQSQADEKIRDEDIKGTWLKVSDDFQFDTAIFTEQRLQAPAASGVNGGYTVGDGQIILAGEVMAEYEIAGDTLYIEALIATEPDCTIDPESATKYVKLVTDD